MKITIRDLIILSGLVSLFIGLWLWWVPAAFIITGIIVSGFGFIKGK